MATTRATKDNASSWIEQQRRIQQLEAENLELHLQLDNLRRGIGLALVIEGRAIPLAVQPSQPFQPSDISALRTHYVQSRPVAPLGLSTPNVNVHAAPRQPYAGPQLASTPVRETASFPEDAWLSDSGNALMSPPQRDQFVPAAPRQITSSQEMTPTWLRENPPAPRTSQRNTANRSQGPHPAQPLQQPQMRMQAPANSLPTAARNEPLPPRTLAQITGQQQLARQRPATDQRNFFADSFVLG